MRYEDLFDITLTEASLQPDDIIKKINHDWKIGVSSLDEAIRKVVAKIINGPTTSIRRMYLSWLLDAARQHNISLAPEVRAKALDFVER